MKRDTLWLAVLAMILAGCSKDTDAPTLTVADLPIPESEISYYAAPDTETPDYSVAEICQLYLADSEAVTENCEFLGEG